MRLLDQYLELQRKIYEYFGFEEGWKVFPIDDAREYFWRLDDGGLPARGSDRRVVFAKTEQELSEESGECFSSDVWFNQELPKQIYRTPDYTMICVDTRTDGNAFLHIFDNAKERTTITS